jgi:hypothetical protein
MHDGSAGGVAGSIARVSLAALFSVITLAFLAIGVASAAAGRWVIALCALALGAWMASFAWSAVRRSRT